MKIPALFKTPATGFRLLPQNPQPRPPASFDSTAKRVSVFAGFNRFSGPYTLTGPQLSFGALVSTRMADPPATMTSENNYIKALASVAAWSVLEGQLLVLNAEKKPCGASKTPDHASHTV